MPLQSRLPVQWRVCKAALLRWELGIDLNVRHRPLPRALLPDYILTGSVEQMSYVGTRDHLKQSCQVTVGRNMLLATDGGCRIYWLCYNHLKDSRNPVVLTGKALIGGNVSEVLAS